MVTIKQIAELCGVSRGTVDRVLNGRGKVKPEKAALVREMAEKLNYRPNPAGKALSARRKQPVVGVLIASEGVHFFDEVLSAMHHRAQKYAWSSACRCSGAARAASTPPSSAASSTSSCRRSTRSS